MSLLALKKIAVTSAVAVGGTYAGVVCYGLTDESMKSIFIDSIPGYGPSIMVASALREGYFDISERLQRAWTKFRLYSVSEKSSISNSTQQSEKDRDKMEANIHSKYRQEIDRLKLQIHKEDDLVKALEVGLQQKYEDLIANFKSEVEEHYNDRLQDAMTQHETELLALRQVFFNKVNTVESRQNQMERTLEAWDSHHDLSSDVQRILLLLEQGYGETFSNEGGLLSTLSQFAAHCADPHLEQLKKIMLRCANSKVLEISSASDLLHACDNSLKLAKEYANFSNDGNVLWFLIPSLRIGRLSKNTHDRLDVLKSIELSIAQRDLRRALQLCNSLEGWSRVMMKPWMRACRRHLELLDASSIVQNYLLATRLPKLSSM